MLVYHSVRKPLISFVTIFKLSTAQHIVGLSRSTAAAFISLCALNPRPPEDAIARALRRSADPATPNRRFVPLADKVMRREGRMIAALNSMGQNKFAYECLPFGIDARHEPNDTGTTHKAA